MRPIAGIILEHCSAVVVVALALLGLAAAIRTGGSAAPAAADPRIARYLAIDSLDWGDPLDRALFRDALGALGTGSRRTIDSLVRAVDDARLSAFADPSRKLGGERARLDMREAAGLLPMFASFLLVFVTVMALTYLSARALALWKFIAWKQGRDSAFRLFLAVLEERGYRGIPAAAGLLVASAARGILALILFSPAYVIAYALRTSVDTGSLLFLVPLAVISNGVLINQANQLFTLLVAESRKGYVETAVVKGLGAAWDWNVPGGLRHRVILFPSHEARAHVFRDIYRNARLQYIPSLKEHAAFVVTGIVIIEMALNISGHLCYALLRHMLYREYDIAIAIAFAIFLTVKVTEACVDVWHALEERRYANVP